MQYKLLFLLVGSILFFSCEAPKDIIYFEKATNLEKVSSKNEFTPVFKVADIVSIHISAADMEAALPFNLSQGQGTTATAASTALGSMQPAAPSSAPSYLIDENGAIEFPVLGTLKIVDLSSIQVKKMLKEKLKVYINDPIINIRLKNFKITVLGEVTAPGSFNIPNEKITLIEALGMAGDMTIKGKRKNVVVIRENKGVNTYHRVDLTSKTIFRSPAYNLAQNDVVYVEPNEHRLKESKLRSNAWGIVIGIMGVLISTISLMVR